MSATLEPFEFYRDLLGFEPTAPTPWRCRRRSRREPPGRGRRRGRHHLPRAAGRTTAASRELVAESGATPAATPWCCSRATPSCATVRGPPARSRAPRSDPAAATTSDRTRQRILARLAAPTSAHAAAAGGARRDLRRGRRLPRGDALAGDRGLPRPAPVQPRARAAQGVLRASSTAAASSTPTSFPGMTPGGPGGRPPDPLGRRPRRHRAHLPSLPATRATPRCCPRSGPRRRRRRSECPIRSPRFGPSSPAAEEPAPDEASDRFGSRSGAGLARRSPSRYTEVMRSTFTTLLIAFPAVAVASSLWFAPSSRPCAVSSRDWSPPATSSVSRRSWHAR